LCRIAGDEVAARVVFKPVERIQKMIVTFPARFKTSRAMEMGFRADNRYRKRHQGLHRKRRHQALTIMAPS
jgi:hypothetical protein